MKQLSDIRRAFLDFFVQKSHLEMPSSALVPHNDPTLMFTNAGMNQFKNIFTGAEAAPEPPRATTAQKCVRAGGKHNDLDNVGYTARHHTFFEMMGNFSFGDYFKDDAIALAWELLTKEFELPADKLYFTVYHDDDEAFSAWKRVTGCSDARILRVPTSDNFWSMGDVGPCGPCSEIFYDHGENLSGEWKLDEKGYDLFDARYVEIWNLVFMQFEQRGADERVNLPKPCVDTGMGLERMATVLQGVQDNYDIDLFTRLIDDIKHISSIDAPDHAASYKVIADHLRSSCFLMSDGVLPSNEGRGYVLRRIMRRAMRHAHMLGCKDPLMHKLVPSLIQEMGEHYSELKRAEALMSETLKSEEERFKQTLERGLKLLDEETATLSTGDSLSGEIAFKLYDTYGFPLDLTQDILRGRDMQVDSAGFDAAMAEQKARARAAWSGSGETAVQEVWFDLRDTHGATEFLGYSQQEAQAIVQAIVKDGESTQTLKAGESALILTNQTPFYGESGGQVGDVGQLIAGKASGSVTNTTKPIAALHAHHVTLEKGELSCGDTVTLTINNANRSAIRAHHSATHLLHAALREVLGEHVTQKGSLVQANRLRFDISHPKQISAEEIAQVEAIVNRLIWQNSAVSTELMDKDAAIEAGAMAMFGEKYDAEVRVLSMGAGEAKRAYSVELCGGTHVARTGDIGLFKIVSEGAVAAGVRRIEALAGEAAYDYLAAQDAQVRQLATALHCSPETLESKLEKLQADKKALEKQLADAKKQLAMGGSGADDALAVEELNGLAFIGKAFGELPPKELRDIATNLAQKHSDAVIAVASHSEGKASVIIAVGKDAEGKADASALIQVAVPAVGGKGGGGKPNFAQCGGPDGDQIEAAIASIKHALREKQAA